MESQQSLETLWQLHLSERAKALRAEASTPPKLVPQRPLSELLKSFENHLDVCRPDGSKVVTKESLNTDSLRALIENSSACAIHVPGFCPPDVAERLSSAAVSECTQWCLDGNIVTDMFYAGGSIPSEVAARNWPDFERYFSEREEFVERQRELSGGQWPVDRLQEQVNKAWPAGASLRQWLGQKMRPAIMRVMHPKPAGKPTAPDHGLGFIHVDDSIMLKPSHGIFSANIYLKLPEQGGNLFIWGVNLGQAKTPRDKLRIAVLGAMGAYVFDPEWQMKFRKILPDPYVISPKVGDLVMIHSGRPHSVEPIYDGVRVTNQLFCHAEGAGPLTISS